MCVWNYELKKIFKLCKWSLPGFMLYCEFPGRYITHLTFHNGFLKETLAQIIYDIFYATDDFFCLLHLLPDI